MKSEQNIFFTVWIMCYTTNETAPMGIKKWMLSSLPSDIEKMPEFISFISRSDFSVMDGYRESWDYINNELHSLERHTNFGLCLVPGGRKIHEARFYRVGRCCNMAGKHLAESVERGTLCALQGISLSRIVEIVG